MNSLPTEITSRELAARLNISERAVHLRAKRGGWPRVYRRVQGGAAHQYLCSGLPEKIRSLLCSPSAAPAPAGQCAAAAAGRASSLFAEADAAAAARCKAKEEGLAAFALLPEARQTEASARREILSARDAFVAATRMPKKHGTAVFVREYRAGAIRLPEWIEEALGTRKERLSLCWATLRRWETAFKEEGLSGLATGYRVTRGTYIPGHMQEFITALLIKRPHIGFPTAREALKARFNGQAIPGLSAVRRFVERWRKEHQALLLHIQNPDAARSRYMPAFGCADEQIERLNQLWEFDSTPGDVMLIDGRHSLIGVIDVYSRRAKLYVSPTSRSAAIAALTRRALLDWGVPEGAKTDNGSDYTSAHMARVFEDLAIEQILCPPFTPEAKPHIERFFRTFSHGIFELLPGYIGHSVAERKEIESRRSFESRLMDRVVAPVEIRMTAAELQVFCDRWCEAVYHHNAHGGLDGKTPAQKAREWKGPVKRIQSERTLDILLCPAPDRNGTRDIGKKGIKVDNAWFIAVEFAGHEGETVFVLQDHTDYGTVYVYRILADGRREFLCQAVNPERTGHDRAEIAAKTKALYKRTMAERSRKLRQVVRKAAVDQIEEEILRYRERKIANLHSFPHRSEEYTTPAIEQAGRAVEEIWRSAAGPQPISITREEERSAAELIDMVEARRSARLIPATHQEKYEQLCEDLRLGVDLSDADLAFMKRHELWLTTGERAQFY